MSREWPEMTDEEKKKVAHLYRVFQSRLQDAADEVLNGIYTDILPHLDKDMHLNYGDKYRSALEYRCINGIAEKSEEHWAQNVRQRIFEEHRAEFETGLIADITKDRDKWKQWYEESQRFK